MKHINYDELLDGKEKARYEELMNMLEKYGHTNTSWELANEYFDIVVVNVSVRFWKNNLPLNIWVEYHPIDNIFHICAKNVNKYDGFKKLEDVKKILDGIPELTKASA